MAEATSTRPAKSSVFTAAERRLLTFLFSHGEQPYAALRASAELGLSASELRKAVGRLHDLDVVRELASGVDLCLEIRAVMMLAVEVSGTPRTGEARHG